MEGQDPALLVYTKDFLEGTADLSAEEFGAYTRLIFHQHQRKVLPKDTKKLARLCGVGISEFKEIWEEIKHKFTLSERGYANKRCAAEIAKRSQSGTLKSILAVYGNWIKANKKLSKRTVLHIKKEFNAFDFVNIEDDKKRKEEILNFLRNEILAFAKRTHIGNENENENESINNNTNSSLSKNFNFKNSLIESGFDKELSNEWMIVRKNKKASNTKTAFNKFISEVEKTNKEKDDILKTCVERSWGKFEAIYLENIEKQGISHGKQQAISNEPRVNRQSISEVGTNQQNIRNIPNPLK
ncbi:YdaU family protein [Wenyingzhuangia sp. 2_MG-2023]|uniref:YdaU family protein n=1 Tax=Wenyingzhuangia sp. 2_MG-2023 TaxID=3062639 RepID=UPI0026E1F429|nr:YdaU family protein [Wenyingzhuangia sp. 2_MG-2023]MDO6737129.1 YdaU family protein [Wenyingzhuangia sp. 2_MG-2023]